MSTTDAHAAPFVRTVLGDVEPTSLGRVNYHEHLFQTTPLLPGEELDDEEASRDEVESMRSAGIESMIDATPWGLGRRPIAVARISRATGVHVVATAGFHREAHYADRPEVSALSAETIAGRCLVELVHGQPERDEPLEASAAPFRMGGGGGRHDGRVRAGILKAGVGYWAITGFESRVLEGVATAHRSTGAPVMVHLEHGTCAHEALDLLAAHGVPEHRVVLAHIDRSPDSILYDEIASRGAYLGCDGAARLKEWPESTLIAAIARAVEAGHEDRILLGGDVARRSRYLAYGGLPGLRYLTDRFVPRLASQVGGDALRSFLNDNPQRLLTWSVPIEPADDHLPAIETGENA